MVTAGISRNSLLTAFSTHCLNGHYCLPTDLRISVWATNIPFIVSLLPVKAESQAELLYKEHIVRNAGQTAFESDSHLIRLLITGFLEFLARTRIATTLQGTLLRIFPAEMQAHAHPSYCTALHPGCARLRNPGCSSICELIQNSDPVLRALLLGTWLQTRFFCEALWHGTK